MKIYYVIILGGFLLLSTNSIAQDSREKHNLRRVDSLMKKMTLVEKIGQLNQYSGREATGPASPYKTNLMNEIRLGHVGSLLNIKGARDTRALQSLALESRLKIPLLFGLDVIHGFKTIFPIPLAEAASWDLDAIRLSAHIAAKETAASGVHWTFAPMVDISRDPRWGRVMEGAGEDPYLGSEIAKARIKGFQGQHLGGSDAIMACAKHFAGYGAAIAGRDYNAVDMSNQMLWETYLPPFKASVSVGVATFMNAFNTLNGIPATGNSYLQRDILKGKWKYKGFVVSDWGSIGEMVQHGFAENDTVAAEKAILAGCDMDMESRAYKNALLYLVRTKRIKIRLINEAVKRILLKKFELGLFDDPYKFSDIKREQEVLNDPSHKLIAREMARKSIVLLKNDSSILPLKARGKTIALIGPLVKSKRDLAGSWVVAPIDTMSIVSLYDGLSSSINKDKILYTKGCDALGASKFDFDNAVHTAARADVVVMALGETWNMSGEAKSKSDINLPKVQEDLFDAIKATGKPVIVILMAGRPMIFDHISKKADAILYAFWLGSEGGNALADVLTGKYNPSARLPISFPENMGQIPINYAVYNTGRPVKNQNDIAYKSAYIDVGNKPKYAFGYGLSYTTFEYKNLALNQSKIHKRDSIKISFTLTNTGPVTGQETVQLYIRDEVSSVVRPLLELKGFKKVTLKPGEAQIVDFTIDNEKLSFYSRNLEFVSEPGKFSFFIGSSSDQLRLKGSFVLLP